MISTSLIRSAIAAFSFLALAASGLPAADDAAAPGANTALPRLVDLGAGKCIPCKQMKPILDELARDYASTFETTFIDVWENRAEGKRYGIRMIPTQIFFDASGKELFRHEGFMAKKDILAKWQELGVALTPPSPANPETTRLDRNWYPRLGDTLVAASDRSGARSVAAP